MNIQKPLKCKLKNVEVNAACLKEALGLSKRISQANCCHLQPWQQAWMIYCLFQKHLQTTKDRHLLQILHTWKFYDTSWVADAVKKASVAFALVWMWLPLGLPGTLQPCLLSSLLIFPVFGLPLYPGDWKEMTFKGYFQLQPFYDSVICILLDSSQGSKLFPQAASSQTRRSLTTSVISVSENLSKSIHVIWEFL